MELDTETTSDMDGAWERFLESQEKTRQYILSQPQYQDSPQSAAEGYRSLLYNLAGAIELSLHDTDFPMFSRMPDLGSKSGMDNPDNEYKMAIIDGSQTYRIQGQLRSRRKLYLQTVFGQPGVGDAGPGTFAGTLTSDQIAFDEDGNYEVIVSPTQPTDNINWLKSEAGIETLLLRYTDSDWADQRAQDWITIERVCDDCATMQPSLSPEDVSNLLNRSSQSLHDRTTSWVGIANRITNFIPANTLGKPRPTPNGLTGQFSAFGVFDLEPDQALIVSIPVSDASYQGIQLGNLWFHSLDYRTRQSSLTRTQAFINEDGTIDYVIAAKDPGVVNWLDTGGLKRGLIFARWQGAETIIMEKPVVTLVQLPEVYLLFRH